MESGSPHATTAKTFFSLCLAMVLYGFFYGKNLSAILSTDLQLVLFWAGVFLVILSAAPAVKWLLRVSIYFWDRKLPAGSFSHWDTLNQPQWERVLNDLIGDIYVASGFTLLSFKFLSIPGFFDGTVPSAIGGVVNTLAIFASAALGVTVITRIAYMIWSRKGDIQQSQRFLTVRIPLGTLDTGSSEYFTTDVYVYQSSLSQVEIYYLNKTWPLFRSAFAERYRLFISQVNDGQVINSIKTFIRKGPHEIDLLSSFHSDIDSWKNEFERGKHYLYPVPRSLVLIQDTLEELTEKLYLIMALRTALTGKKFQAAFSTDEVISLLGPNPDWGSLQKTKRETLQLVIDVVLETRKKRTGKTYSVEITGKWVESLYIGLKDLLDDLTDLFDELEELAGK